MLLFAAQQLNNVFFLVPLSPTFRNMVQVFNSAPLSQITISATVSSLRTIVGKTRGFRVISGKPTRPTPASLNPHEALCGATLCLPLSLSLSSLKQFAVQTTCSIWTSRVDSRGLERTCPLVQPYGGGVKDHSGLENFQVCYAIRRK